MGRRGYVQRRHAEHDTSVCLSDWAQAQAVRYLEDNGINVYTGDSSGMTDPGTSDHWEIEIPMRKTRGGKFVRDFRKLEGIILDLRKNPHKVTDDMNEQHAEELADILETGMRVAESRGYEWIMVDFW